MDRITELKIAQCRANQEFAKRALERLPFMSESEKAELREVIKIIKRN